MTLTSDEWDDLDDQLATALSSFDWSVSDDIAITVASSADAGPVWVPAVRVDALESPVRSVLLGPLAGPRSPPLSVPSYF